MANLEQKERLLSLFTEEAKSIIKDKYLEVETILLAGKEIQIIYIADDELVKESYKKEFMKDPEFVSKGKAVPM